MLTKLRTNIMKPQLVNLSRNYNMSMRYYLHMGNWKKHIEKTPAATYYEIMMNMIYESVYDSGIAFLKDVEHVQYGYEGVMVYAMKNFRVSAGMPMMKKEAISGAITMIYGHRWNDEEYDIWPDKENLREIRDEYLTMKHLEHLRDRVISFMKEKLAGQLNIAEVMKPGDKYEEFKPKKKPGRKRKEKK